MLIFFLTVDTRILLSQKEFYFIRLDFIINKVNNIESQIMKLCIHAIFLVINSY